MARSRHGRSRGGPSSAGAGLPSWAQRHLDEAGDPVTAADLPAYSSTRHRHGSAGDPHRLRGWGVAVVAVAAAVGAVPLAITSLANDHSDDPLPKVDTYTAGSPAPLEADGGSNSGGRHRADAPAAPAAPGTDPATAGVLAAPPVAAAPIVPGPRVPAAVPAALVRATPTVTPTTTTKATTPRSATTPTATTTTTTSTGEGRTATPPKTKPKPAPKPKPAAPSSNDDGGGSKQSGGLVSNTVRGLGNTVGDVTGSLGL